MRHFMRIAVCTVAVAGSACETEVSDPDTGEVVDNEFAFATASSRVSPTQIVTELRDSEDELLATAEWDVDARTGVLSIDSASFPIELGDQALDGQVANIHTYDVWLQNQQAVDAAYDVQCYLDHYPCADCLSCSDCFWGGPEYFPIYHCIVIGGGCWSNGQCSNA